MIGGPYKITEEMIERHDLDDDDLGKWMLVVNGSLQIIEGEENAVRIRDMLNDDTRRNSVVKDWAYYANLD
jgi:hypothetical protein